MPKETTRTQIARFGALAMLLGWVLWVTTADRLFQGWWPFVGICLVVVGVAAYVYGIMMNREKPRRKDETEAAETKL